MNIYYIINLLKKNLIITILLLVVIGYNFYNVFNKIIKNHPIYEISSIWISNENSLFLKISLLGNSISDEYNRYIEIINDVIKVNDDIKLSNDEQNDFVNKEIIDFNFKYNEETGKLVGKFSTSGLLDLNKSTKDNFFPNKDIFRTGDNYALFDNFDIFTVKQINSFYYDHLLRIIRDEIINQNFLGATLFNTPDNFSIPPYGVQIELKTLSQYNDISTIKNMDLYMDLSNKSFNSKIKENIEQFIEWVIEDVEDLSDRAVSQTDINKKSVDLIDKYTILVIDKLNQRKEELKSLDKLNSSLFIKDREQIKNLQEDINFKILTNFVTHLIVFIFLTSLFIYLREIFNQQYNNKEINK